MTIHLTILIFFPALLGADRGVDAARPGAGDPADRHG